MSSAPSPAILREFEQIVFFILCSMKNTNGLDDPKVPGLTLIISMFQAKGVYNPFPSGMCPGYNIS